MFNGQELYSNQNTSNCQVQLYRENDYCPSRLNPPRKCTSPWCKHWDFGNNHGKRNRFFLWQEWYNKQNKGEPMFYLTINFYEITTSTYLRDLLRATKKKMTQNMDIKLEVKHFKNWIPHIHFLCTEKKNSSSNMLKGVLGMKNVGDFLDFKGVKNHVSSGIVKSLEGYSRYLFRIRVNDNTIPSPPYFISPKHWGVKQNRWNFCN